MLRSGGVRILVYYAEMNDALTQEKGGTHVVANTKMSHHGNKSWYFNMACKSHLIILNLLDFDTNHGVRVNDSTSATIGCSLRLRVLNVD